MFGFGRIKGLKVPHLTVRIHAHESGSPVITIGGGDVELPEADYVILATPFKTDGRAGDEGIARRELDMAAGLVCAHTGVNALHGCMAEGELHGSNGALAMPGVAIKVPQAADGPFLANQNGLDVAEIVVALAQQHPAKRGRLELSVSLVHAGIRDAEGFFNYWMALEVVTDGKANRIKERFRSIYRLASHKEAGEVLGINTLAQWRGAYVHRGQRPQVVPDVERYMQLLYLDLLRYEVGLPPRWHAAALQQASGYDLSSIGLRDNRTEEQRLRTAKPSGAIADRPGST